MAVVGIGVDAVLIERFVASLARTSGLAARLFTEAERELPDESLAARFAAKEAVAKAIGAPKGLQWHDVEVQTGDGGRPLLAVRGAVAAVADSMGVRHWHLSLSHDGGIAVAMVVAES
ncbi:MAG: holo-[acyl-carrier protein] synthase [Frankiales bacterium]|nr:holo-[acyl-carrier protein] synthase [Frankiales bacterium]